MTRSLRVLRTIPRAEASGPFISGPFATQAGFFLLCHQHLVSRAHLQPGGIQAPSSLDPRRRPLYCTPAGPLCALLSSCTTPLAWAVHSRTTELADLPERISAHALKYFSSMFSPPEGDNLGEINKVYSLYVPSPCQHSTCYKIPRVHRE